MHGRTAARRWRTRRGNRRRGKRRRGRRRGRPSAAGLLLGGVPARGGRPAVGAGGRDLNKLASQATRLQGDVDFAMESLSSAMRAADNSRMESQRQLKFIVMLSKPLKPTGPEMSWRWKVFLSCLGVLIVVWGVGGFMLTALRRN